MKAMILAAGKGTRLRPVTDIMPKALVEINGVTLLERAVQKLQHADIDEIVINVHHFADQIEHFLSRHDLGVRIHVSDEREGLLDTGGAVKKARSYLEGEDPFFVCNVDVISNINLLDMLYLFQMSPAMAVLAVRKRESTRQLCFDEYQHLVGWKNRETGELKGKDGLHYAFSGIQLLHPGVFEYMPPQERFSLIDLYLDMARQQIILAYDHTDGEWMDVGTPERLKKAIALFKS
ncbi:MAG: nucleotidyltransferase family protein [Candidatus Neomarinimicrobiota bacterium]|jgi:NDP-sugar pyrophosphorylase family protein|nr:nucleotidyltransferase family protein [Candidatus Neomarinimicrobiota bacterium]MDD3966713.1 nucleotidyltransferase family protein [Candidatus Neomarinimicrobiota bacterium]MDX9779688.1 nucleotidyltransferase family protein [bacterium]